jgi:hypothetical protein
VEAEREALEQFDVLEENWEALRLWIDCQGFYRYGAMGGLLGLDWQQIHGYASLSNLSAAADDWRRLRIIEGGFISVFNED